MPTTFTESHDLFMYSGNTAELDKMTFYRVFDFLLLPNSLFDEKHFNPMGNNWPSNVVNRHGKREVKAKGETTFWLKVEISTSLGCVLPV